MWHSVFSILLASVQEMRVRSALFEAATIAVGHNSRHDSNVNEKEISSIRQSNGPQQRPSSAILCPAMSKGCSDVDAVKGSLSVYRCFTVQQMYRA